MNRDVGNALEIILHMLRVIESGNKVASDDVAVLKDLIEAIKFQKKSASQG